MLKEQILCTLLVAFPLACAPIAEQRAEGGIWVSRVELALLPTSGHAWEKVNEVAHADLEPPNLAGYTSNHDAATLAIALVYARTGDAASREQAANAITSAIGTEHTGRIDESSDRAGALAVTVGRNLVSYVIAADLIGLGDYDPVRDQKFRVWIDGLRRVQWPDGSLIENDEGRPNNHGRMAGASRAAIAVYLADRTELERTARVFRTFLGDNDAHAGFTYKRDTSWQASPDRPLGVNPRGASKAGLLIDGALPEEMRRGCPFQIPPCQTGYPWEGLQGVIVEAVILGRQGFDVWNWGDRAILRAVEFLADLEVRYPEAGWWARGDDRWIPWVVNHFYGTRFPTEPTKGRPGKNMAFTDWTHAGIGPSARACSKPCDDGDPCNGYEFCNGAACRPGRAMPCSDRGADAAPAPSSN